MTFQKVFFYHSQSFDPFINIALEDYLFRYFELKKGEMICLLYRNQPSVVIGHFQNPWRECHLQLMEQDFVTLVRRLSGGGAVYHDLGNLNYSFINQKSDNNLEFNSNILRELLIYLGIEENAIKIDEKRRDIFINGFKISGSAFKNIKDRSYHHGTLLVDSPLEKLMSYLDSPIKGRIKGKLVPSKRSNVTSLKELGVKASIEGVSDGFRNLLRKFFQGLEEVSMTRDSFFERKEFQERLSMIRQKEFIYGETPRFVFDNQETIENGIYSTGPKKNQEFQGE